MNGDRAEVNETSSSDSNREQVSELVLRNQ